MMGERRAVLILMLVIVFLLMQVPMANPSELTVPEKTLAFLEDVVMLDMTKYNATLEIFDVRYPDDLHGLAQHNVLYMLLSDEGTLEAAFGFKNESFAHCMLGTIGSPLYSQPQPANIVDAAKGFLQRYQTYTGDPNFDGVRDFEKTRSILDTVDVTENVTAMSDYVKLEVIRRTDYTALVWDYVLDGVAFPWMTLEFRDGFVCGFDDIWRLYTAGSTDIIFSEEDVVNVALEYLEDFSWTAGDEEVTGFDIIEEPRHVELFATRSREPLTVYPYWRIELYLDKVYPGNVNRISLAIWADTGEIISCIPLGGGGVMPIPEFPSESTIYIRVDGSIEGTDDIQRDGNIYTFTDNIYDSLVVESDNVVVDGAGYSIEGTHNGIAQSSEGIGILVESRSKVTISNVTIQNFLYGIYINSSSNNLITKSNITNNNKGIIIEHSSHTIIRESQITNNFDVGIYVLESPHTDIQNSVIADNVNDGVNVFFVSTNLDDHEHCDISNSTIRDNKVGIRIMNSLNSSVIPLVIDSNITNNSVGIHLESSLVIIQFNNLANNGVGIQTAGSDNRISHNNFINNTKQVYDVAWDNPEMTPSVNNWDVGDDGNYWSNYNGTGDMPYVIDENNQDNFPIMKPLRIPRQPFLPDNQEDFTISNIVWSVIILAVVGVVFLVYRVTSRKTIKEVK